MCVCVWNQGFQISKRESVEGIMGALMVIFSLQPKQRAKEKGRLLNPFITVDRSFPLGAVKIFSFSFM